MSWPRSRFAAGFFAGLFTAGLALAAVGARSSAAPYEELAVFVGETTYGKGSVQSLFELPDGAGVRLTTARYTTPAGRAIEGAGIAPDLQVVASPHGSSEDAQLARALDELKKPQLLEALRSAAPPAARAE